MLCLNLVCVILLISGFYLPESFCCKEAKLSFQGELSGESYSKHQEVRRIKPAETIATEGATNHDQCLHSRGVRDWGACFRSWGSRKTERSNSMDVVRQAKPLLASSSGSMAKTAVPSPRAVPSPKAVPENKGGWFKRMFRLKSGKITGQLPNDTEALLQCALNASVKSLSPLLAIADLVKRKLDENAPNEKAALRRDTIVKLAEELDNVIDPQVQDAFVKAATDCYGLFERDRSGKLQLVKNFANSKSAENIKRRPGGQLAVGALNAIVQNVVLKPGEGGRLNYEIDKKGLAAGLTLAVTEARFTEAVRIGEIAAKYILRIESQSESDGASFSRQMSRNPSRKISIGT